MLKHWVILCLGVVIAVSNRFSAGNGAGLFIFSSCEELGGARHHVCPAYLSFGFLNYSRFRVAVVEVLE